MAPLTSGSLLLGHLPAVTATRPGPYSKPNSATTSDALFVCPGDLIAKNGLSLLRGRGVVKDAYGDLRASIPGRLDRVSQLVYVQPGGSKNTGGCLSGASTSSSSSSSTNSSLATGDVVIGRIAQVLHGKWAVDVGVGSGHATLPLAAIHLPNNEQRRRTAEDHLQIREYFKENDLIVAEVQRVTLGGGGGAGSGSAATSSSSSSLGGAASGGVQSGQSSLGGDTIPFSGGGISSSTRKDNACSWSLQSGGGSSEVYLQTRSAKYGLLRNGVLVCLKNRNLLERGTQNILRLNRVPVPVEPMSVEGREVDDSVSGEDGKRPKCKGLAEPAFVSLQLILGANGWIWIQAAPENTGGVETLNFSGNDSIADGAGLPPKVRKAILEYREALLAMDEAWVRISMATLEREMAKRRAGKGNVQDVGIERC
ncbi:unnamed protein product [Amoebophrya sp. A25]|nr:unnamed protein product [Amoebophrya sp. A25]|eukprot:GSA25T00012871001.1